MSVRYGEIRALAGRLREEATPDIQGRELDLQARFFRGELGTTWQTEDGVAIELLHPGRWNREPGPDFCDALVRIGGMEQRGDIEIDIFDRDWEAHGHAENPAFAQVILHGFFLSGHKRFFTRDHRHREVPQIRFDLEAKTTPWRDPVSQGEILDEGALQELLTAASEWRLRRKWEAFRSAARLNGEEEALFQALATGLGYKNNKIPFLLVAQRVGCRRARHSDGESLLFGLAGFLQADYFDRGGEWDRRYLRDLWERWWPLRDKESRLTLEKSEWKMSTLRPANHPHRRMGALAALARISDQLIETVRGGDLKRVSRLFGELEHPYWAQHWNLASDLLPKPMALIGAERTLDLIINAVIPAQTDFARAFQLWRTTSGPTANEKIRNALCWLGGEGVKPSAYASAADQQGLLQIYEDFFPLNPVEVWKKLHSRSTLS